MNNPLDYEIAQALRNKFALRYAETRDQSLINKMAALEHFLTELHIRETKLAFERLSLPNQRTDNG